MAGTQQVDVFQYLDYRLYLRDFYLAEKETNKAFSFRYFSRRIGVKGPSHLKRVIDGERSLTRAMIDRYAEAIRLDPEAASYFSALVGFNDAPTLKERERAYGRLSSFRRYQRAHRLDIEQAEYFSNWYVPAIREMVSRSDFRNDPAWIAQQLRPRVSLRQAKSAIRVLVRLGLVVEDEDGRITAVDEVVSTGSEAQWVHLRNYHRVMLQQAADAIDNFPPAERDISSVTLSVGPDGLARIKERLAEFRQELLSCFEDASADQVVQVNLQLHPLTTKAGEKS